MCWCVRQRDAVIAGNKQDAHQIEKRGVPPAVHSNWSAQFDRPLSSTSVGLEGLEMQFICVRPLTVYLHFCAQLIIPFLNYCCHPTPLLVAAELLSGSTDPEVIASFDVILLCHCWFRQSKLGIYHWDYPHSLTATRLNCTMLKYVMWI